MPLSWVMFALFWNGAVMFHIHKLFGRILANVFIWDFLLVPGVFYCYSMIGLLDSLMPILCLPWLLDNCQLKSLLFNGFCLCYCWYFNGLGLSLWLLVVSEVSDERAPLLVEVQETVTE